MTVREAAGLLLFHGLVLAIGFAVLRLAGLVGRRRSTWLLGIGAAHLAGLAVLGLTVSLALTAGLTLRVPAIVGLAVVLAAALAGIGWRRRAAPVPMLALPSRWHLVAPALVLALLVGEAAVSGSVGTAWDAAHMWTVKAVTISYDGNIGAPLFHDAATFGNSRLDYPLMQPVLGSMAFRFAGGASQGLLAAELWLLAAAFVLAVPFVLRTLRVEATLPIAVAVAASPVTGVLRGDADVTFAVFLAVGVLCLGQWLRAEHRGTLAFGALMLAAAANVKNEGLVFGAIALVVALPFAARRGRPALLALLAAGVAVAALAAPWHLWVGAHGPFPGDQASLGQMLDWGFLRPRVHQLDYAARALLGQLADQSDKGWIIPALGALGLVGLARRPRDGLAVWCLAIVVGMCVALLWVYWSSPGDGVALVNVNIDRTVTGPLYVAAAVVALLLVRRPAETPPTGRPDGARTGMLRG